MAALRGLNNVIRNINILANQIEKKSVKGLIKAAALIRRDMENTSPLIPVDTGNLRASWFVVTSKGGTPRGKTPKFKGKKAVELRANHSVEKQKGISELKHREMAAIRMGFSANYAFYVHETLGGVSAIIKGRGKKKQIISPLTRQQKIAFGFKTFRRPGAGPKFFEAALRRNQGKIIRILLEEAKIR
jgi:hypothetical protein